MATEQIVTLLLQKLQSGNRDAFRPLLEQYLPLLHSVVDSFRDSSVLSELEKEDLIQEATLALYKAAVSYDCKQNEVTFGLYAKICIKNRLISNKRKLDQKKRKSSIATKKKKTVSKNGSKRAFDVDVSSLLALAKEDLTPLEQSVFDLYLQGVKYREIAGKLGISVKAVDNALSRAKRKFKAHLPSAPSGASH